MSLPKHHLPCPAVDYIIYDAINTKKDSEGSIKREICLMSILAKNVTTWAYEFFQILHRLHGVTGQLSFTRGGMRRAGNIAFIWRDKDVVFSCPLKRDSLAEYETLSQRLVFVELCCRGQQKSASAFVLENSELPSIQWVSWPSDMSPSLSLVCDDWCRRYLYFSVWYDLNPRSAELFLFKPWRPKAFFKLKSS